MAREENHPEKRPEPYAQDPSRTPPTKEQRETDYQPEKKETGEAARGHGRIGRKTEDEMARDHLGGVKGSKELEPAPLTNTESEQMLPNDDDGHPA
jgi:hypothetical protein